MWWDDSYERAISLTTAILDREDVDWDGLAETNEVIPVHLWSSEKHPAQKRMVESTSKRLMVRAGRRGGKTEGAGIKGTKRFLAGGRVLYAAPTSEQTDAFWYSVKRALMPLVKAGRFKLNESERFIELLGTKQRIKAKTAWNANTLRGDYADLLILDEFQLQAEDTWNEVGQPMLLDNNGDAVFIYTPPSLMATGVSKARDPRHASKMFKEAMEDASGLWETIHWTSLENPFISKEGLAIVTSDMSLDAYRREILAEDDDIEQSWLVYSKFNEALCRIKRFEIPKNWLVYSGHDFGQANPGALFLAQVKLPIPQDAPGYIRYGDYVIFREYCPGAGFSIPQHRDRFKELTVDYKIERSVGGSVHGEDEIRQGYGAHGWPIQAPVFDRVMPQIDRVIGLFELNKIYIFDDLYNLLAQLSNCLWVLDDENHTTNKVKDEFKYHLLAALRYIGSYFTPETVVSRKIQQKSFA
ncbi:hypothetical protein LCGC14_1206070 [marine sediment metagenome]|uniref:Terminase large subunit gp17-like C-terminal domain-containing protein n=1 Tax=marine sediment metagenome TaxID=412755 RepID=A0A0F9LFD1_9ZZZZ